MISQGMHRIQVRSIEAACSAALDTRIRTLRITEVLHHLDIGFWPFARAIAAQLRANNITKSQQVAYVLFQERNGRSRSNGAEDGSAAVLPSSIDVRLNMPLP
eukprot:4696576-Heterocapsa_arctica.AAC.1